MTQEEYGTAYERGRKKTINFLRSRGVPEDDAQEATQAAWVRGWERRHQIRDKQKALSWVNSIALNMYRSTLSDQAHFREFLGFSVPPRINLEAIDVEKMLKRCHPRDRALLEDYYLDGRETRELAAAGRCSEVAIRVRLVRARESLRRRLKRPAPARSRKEERTCCEASRSSSVMTSRP